MLIAIPQKKFGSQSQSSFASTKIIINLQVGVFNRFYMSYGNLLFQEDNSLFTNDWAFLWYSNIT